MVCNMCKYDDKIMETLSFLNIKVPSMYSCLSEISSVVVGKVAGITRAAACYNKSKKTYDIVFDSDFFELLKMNQRAFLMEHELQHVVCNHFLRIMDKNMCAGRRDLYNYATDAVINGNCVLSSDVVKSGEFPGGLITDTHLNNEFGINCSSFKNTSEEIYEMLLKSGKVKEIPSFCQTDAGDMGSDESDNEGRSEIDEKIESFIRQNQDQLQKDYGNKSLGRLLSDYLGSKKKSEIQKAMKRFVAKSIKANEIKTYRRRDRRKWDKISKGVRKDHDTKILICLDVSGSMMDEKILQFMADEIYSLSSYVSFDVAWGDTELRGKKHIKQGRRFDFSEIDGGGGTVLDFFVEESEKGQYDGAIYVTDGYFSPLNTSKVDRLMLIVPKGTHPKSEKCIDLDF